LTAIDKKISRRKVHEIFQKISVNFSIYNYAALSYAVNSLPLQKDLNEKSVVFEKKG